MVGEPDQQRPAWALQQAGGRLTDSSWGWVFHSLPGVLLGARTGEDDLAVSHNSCAEGRGKQERGMAGREAGAAA